MPNSPAATISAMRCEARVILQQVADHQDATAARGEIGQFQRLGGIQRQGLFDEHVFVGQQRAAHHLVMRRCGRRDEYGGDRRVFQNLFEKQT